MRPEISPDVDGCIRRKCADCGRHFASSIEHGGQLDQYWCPYCGAQRSWECWFTHAQRRYLEDGLAEDALAMVDREMDEALTELARTSGGVVQYRPIRNQPTPRAPLDEATVGLAAFSMPCHPGARLKLEPTWSRAVWCHLCGTQAQDGRAVVGRLRLRPRES